MSNICNKDSGYSDGIVRLAVNFEAWSPSETEWQDAINLIEQSEPEEVARILRFKRLMLDGSSVVGRFNPDSKSSLLGRILLRNTIFHELGIPWNEIHFGRTDKGKPYLINHSYKFPNFNFNVSHAGKWVVLASEPFFLVGIDVMEMKVRGQTSPEEYIQRLDRCFSPLEREVIHRSDNDFNKKIEQLFRFWTLKEAYLKAIGIGLGFSLDRTTFILDREENASKASVLIDGKEMIDWHFTLDYPDTTHVISCAIGPPNEAIASFKSIFPWSNSNLVVSQSKESSVIGRPRKTFRILSVGDLLNLRLS